MEEKGFYEIEEGFHEFIDEVKGKAADIDKVDLVIGIPFYNETKSLPDVIKTAKDSFQDGDIKKLIVCAGDPAGEEALGEIKQRFGQEVVSFQMPQGINGRGFSIRAILEIARSYDADVVLLEADLESHDGHGIGPGWIERLAKPILNKYDISVASFRRHPFEDTVGTLLVSPLISSLYGIRLSDPLSGVYGISHDIVKEICGEFDQSHIKAGGYGFNPWFITEGLRDKKRICEVNLGAKLSPMNFEKKHIVMKQMLRALLDSLKKDEEILLRGETVTKGVDIFGAEDRDLPTEISCDPAEFVTRFKDGYYHYNKLLQEVLGDEIFFKVKAMAESSGADLDFPFELWGSILYKLIIAYCSEGDIPKEDLLELTIVMYSGVLAGYLLRVIKLRELVKDSGTWDESWLAGVVREFSLKCGRGLLEQKSIFQQELSARLEEKRLPLTPIDYLEHIPGVPIVLPKILTGQGGKEVLTTKVFKKVEKKYRAAFKDFLQVLGVDTIIPSDSVTEVVQRLMADLEETVDQLCPGDLLISEGTKEVAESIFRIFSKDKVTSIREEVIQKLLMEFPPDNLVIKLGYENLEEMLGAEDLRTVLTLAGFTEDKDYFDKIYFWLQDNLRPDSFEMIELRPLIVERNEFQGLGQVRQISDLNRLTARIAVMNLSKGTGGKYPKLRYFTRIAKSIVEAEHFSLMVETYARERKEIGRKFINSILGHFGKAMFSGHHIFENWHHREFVDRLREFSQTLKQDGAAVKVFDAMAQGYGLSMVLTDGSFIPCSAWTWASFSFQGGSGTPTPMFLRVERDWFNHDLFEELYREMGYRTKGIMGQIFQLISQGRESVDLSGVLLGVKPIQEEVVIQELSNWPKAGMLKRHPGNPILDPIEEHFWENQFVLNTAAQNLDGKTYLLYRAFGDDKISRVGLAVVDGEAVMERLDYPIFEPGMEQEKSGCEDPRTVLIDDEILMLYTAYDGIVAQIAAASISVKDFLNRKFENWKRRGLAFPGLWDKDAIIFPEKIKGKYVIYHRIEPSIWIAYSDELVFPWPTAGHKIIMGPRSGMMWDSLKIGAGAQPIKTKYGWLLIYHGVDQEMVYSLGVMLVELEDPGKILYRSPNPILTPETECEIGRSDECWVPNVVFTCGAVAEEEKEILDDDDNILVYYGAADTNICLAMGTVAEMIPESVRQKIKVRKAVAQTH